MQRIVAFGCLLLARARAKDNILHEMAQQPEAELKDDTEQTIKWLSEALGDTSIEERGTGGMTPLHMAAAMGTQRVLDALLKYGAKVNAVDDKGRCALHWVLQHPRNNTDLKDRIDALVKHGAQVNKQDNDGLAPIHMAVHTGRIPALKMLRGHHADINQRSTQGAPLHFAAMIGSGKAIRALHKVGADLEARFTGYTPIHCAAMTDQPVAIKTLAKVGAQVEALSGQNVSALQLAVTLGKLRSIRAMIWAGADIHAEYNGATAMELAGSNVTLLRALSTLRVKGETVDDDYPTPQKSKDEL